MLSDNWNMKSQINKVTSSSGGALLRNADKVVGEALEVKVHCEVGAGVASVGQLLEVEELLHESLLHGPPHHLLLLVRHLLLQPPVQLLQTPFNLGTMRGEERGGVHEDYIL